MLVAEKLRKALGQWLEALPPGLSTSVQDTSAWKQGLLRVEVLSQHAMKMRVKRLCQRTERGKLQVPEDVHQQWVEGSRDEILWALVRALKLQGFGNDHETRKKVRAGLFVFSIFWNLLDLDDFGILCLIPGRPGSRNR